MDEDAYREHLEREFRSTDNPITSPVLHRTLDEEVNAVRREFADALPCPKCKGSGWQTFDGLIAKYAHIAGFTAPKRIICSCAAGMELRP